MKIVVKEENLIDRLDKYLPAVTDFSRSKIQKMIEDKHVLVNGKGIDKKYVVMLNDVIEIEDVEPQECELTPQDIEYETLYEDKDIMVINKPKGLVVHPGNGNVDNTLVNGLLYNVSDLSEIGGVVRPGIVHRIDKDTSGCLIIAKNDKAHNVLSEDFKNHKVEKTYIALVRGIIEEEQATINIPIARSKTDRKKMAVSKDGKQAITHFEVLQRFETSNTTVVKVNIETGRTHQIRVHMSYLKHPIIGDLTYSNGKNIWGVEGQMLHSYLLEFNHPITKEKMKISAPLPKYFKDILTEQFKENNLNLDSKNIFLKAVMN